MSSASFTADDAVHLHAAVVAGGVVDADPQAFVAAARSALELDRADAAIVLARAALGLAPSSASAWTVLGDASWSLGDVAAARAAWEEALSLDDRDLGTALSCARAQLQTDDVGAARALVTFVLTRAHTDALRAMAVALLTDIDAGNARGATP
jgi:predicted TPR repeat methyltransferase